MQPLKQHACPRSFVVPTNNPLHSPAAALPLLLFWLCTALVLHPQSRFSSTLKAGDRASRQLRLSVWTANYCEQHHRYGKSYD